MPAPGPSAFLRLTPENYEAKAAFRDVVMEFEYSSDALRAELNHAVRSMSYEFMKKPEDDDAAANTIEELVGWLDGEASPSPFPSEAESDDHTKEPLEPIQWKGYYFLSFDTPPLNVRHGWRIGSGRWNSESGKPPGLMDLQLVLPRTPFSDYELAGHHATIFFDDSGSLTLQASKTRDTTIRYDDLNFTWGQCHIWKRQAYVKFGKLEYTLEFIEMGEGEYQKQIELRYASLQLPAPPPDMSATPSTNDDMRGGWILRETVAKGGFGRVRAAKHIGTGDTGAAKELQRDSKDQHLAIQREVNIMSALPDHPQVLQLKAVFYEHGHASWPPPLRPGDSEGHGSIPPETVTLIFTPYARTTMSEHLPKLVGPLFPLRLVAFRQLLRGVAALHAKGIIHHDIKLSNWGVVDTSFKNFTTVILDYGLAVEQRSCQPSKERGTASYRAPEMRTTWYGQKVDVWSCGVIGLVLLWSLDGQRPWQSPPKDNREIDEHFRKHGEPTSADKAANPTRAYLYGLLRAMLQWDPKERISAEEALNHRVFQLVAEQYDSKDPRTGEKHRLS